MPTLNKTTLSYATVCVKFNVLKPGHDSLRIRLKNLVIKLSIFHETIPLYSSQCKHVGHGIKDCY